MPATFPLLARCSAAACLTFALLGSPANAADAPQTKPATTKPAVPKPAVTPRPEYQPIVDEPGLPRVLLIGDSISIGYHFPVRDRLKGKANVHRPPTNCAATINGLDELDQWLGDPATPAGKWDVIHFNFGLHDLKYQDGKGNIKPIESGVQQTTLADYEKNLRLIVQRLKKTGAALVFATTTPVPEGARGRVPADVPKYNEVALRVMKDENVTVDDLNAFITPKLAETQNKADVHYRAAGYKALGDEVSKHVEAALAGRKAK